MTTEKMTVHKALSELKILDDRIHLAISEAVFCVTNKHSNEKIKLKKSHKGCCVVQRDYYDNDLYCIDGLEGIRQNSELKTVFKDGRIVHRDTFEEIRNRLNGEI